MKLHEYQSKELLRKCGVKLLRGKVCFDLKQSKEAISEIGLPCVIKAQVHAGGRGKAGGIKVAHDSLSALSYAEEILKLTIKTAQTGEKGQKVSSVLIEEGAEIREESYLSILVDREKKQICFLVAKEGGMDIEELSLKYPDKIKKMWVNRSIGLMPYQIRNLLDELAIEKSMRPKWILMAQSLYRAFIENDASLLEINPLATLKGGDLVALDAKMIIDDNALFRQPHIVPMRDISQEDEKEVEAFNHNLSYVSLDGNIGCMVNGAGLAMATMDMIKYVGGNPANFLDVGGSATKERVEEALKIMVSDNKVKTIFINVFGGIVKCDLIASGVVKAAQTLNLKLPLVVRLEGTNVDQGRQILSRSGLTIYPATNMYEGAKRAKDLAGA